MAQDVFHFKQFSIYQPNAGMRVSTDACIQAAICVAFLKENIQYNTKNILDIGTGTGLLTLMLVQAFPSAKYTAVELDEGAIIDARHNFQNSKWSDAIRLYPNSIQSLEIENDGYDIIICNPPFFDNQLQSPTVERNNARHDIMLSKEQLALEVSKHLNPKGVSCILYPTSEWEQWLESAYNLGLHLVASYHIRPFAHKSHNRIVGFFGFDYCKDQVSNDLIIYKEQGIYTKTFIELLVDYYTIL